MNAEITPLVRLFRGLVSPHRVLPHWWGSLVTDARCPDLWDANCAVIETTAAIPPLLEEIELELLPTLTATGAPREHVVLLCPDAQHDLLAELSERGDQIGWDAWMRYEGPADPPQPDGIGPEVEDVGDFDDEFWSKQRRALSEFGVKNRAAVQLESVERRLVESGAKRWVTIRVEGEMAAFGAIQTIDPDLVYVDNVLTFPEVRGRGFATAIVDHLIRENAPDRQLFLLTEVDRGPAALYERLGFREQGRIASSLRTVM
jgi:GNAT superfamily N-acetyltransferase